MLKLNYSKSSDPFLGRFKGDNSSLDPMEHYITPSFSEVTFNGKIDEVICDAKKSLV